MFRVAETPKEGNKYVFVCVYIYIYSGNNVKKKKLTRRCHEVLALGLR